MEAQAFIGMGSNLAHPRRQLARAARALSRIPATRVVAVSSNYTSAPDGADVPQPDYVNAVAQVVTSLPPRALLRELMLIERRQQRTRDAGGRRNLPRTLDLDLLLYGARTLRTGRLSLPHPRMHERALARSVGSGASSTKIDSQPSPNAASSVMPVISHHRSFT